MNWYYSIACIYTKTHWWRALRLERQTRNSEASQQHGFDIRRQCTVNFFYSLADAVASFVKALHNFFSVNTVFLPIDSYILSVFIKKNAVFATYLADQHFGWARTWNRIPECVQYAHCESVCARLWQIHTHKQNPNLWLGHFCICVFAVNSVASDSQICRIYYIVGFFLALSHFESRRLIFFISFSVCAVLSASPFSGTYHLFQRCNVHISTQTVQWKWRRRKKPIQTHEANNILTLNGARNAPELTILRKQAVLSFGLSFFRVIIYLEVNSKKEVNRHGIRDSPFDKVSVGQ